MVTSNIKSCKQRIVVYLLKLKSLSGRLIVQCMVQLKMKPIKYKLLKTEEFDEWLNEQSPKSRVQIADRLERVQDEGYFGDHKDVRENIWKCAGKMDDVFIIH